MNELQQIEFDILKKLDSICKEYGIHYFLAYGTVLGAVRHKGFIPWDDDIDVIMFREEYEKFCSLPADAFQGELFLQTVYTDVEYPFPFAKLRKNGTAYVEQGMEKIRMHHGIFVDIFPLDYIPQKRTKQFIQRFWAEYLWIFMAKNRIQGGMKRILVNLLNLGCKEDKEKYIERIRKLEKKIECSKEENSDKLALMTYGGRARYAKEYFLVNDFDTIYMEFEGQKFPVMSGYDKLLSISYGDYMQIPPENKREQHLVYYANYEKEYQVI